jgi:hypothetical protein
MKLNDFYDDRYLEGSRNMTLWRVEDNLSKIIIETDLLANNSEFVCGYTIYINLNSIGSKLANYETVYHKYFDSRSSTLIADILLARNNDTKAYEFFDKWVIPEIEKQISERDFIKGIFNIRSKK